MLRIRFPLQQQVKALNRSGKLRQTRLFSTSIIDRITGRAAVAAENKDVGQLEKFSILTEGLKDVTIPPGHLIFDQAKLIREHALSALEQKQKRDEVLVEVEKYVGSKYDENKSKLEGYSSVMANVEDVASSAAADSLLESRLSLRLLFLQMYLKHLKSAVVLGDVQADKIDAEFLIRIVDASLLGSSSERLLEHMKLFGPELNQQQLQDCFYLMFDPEVACTFVAFKAQKGLHKHHVKRFPKLAKNYLLDVLELNTKSRCVFSWSDPTFSGFKPFPETHTFPLDTIINSRRQFLVEALSVSHGMMDKYLKERKWWYYEKKEFRSNMKIGFVFFVVTCFIDWGICVMRFISENRMATGYRRH